jgi:hypothetical protein
MLNLREWKARRAERRAAKIAALADRTARQAAEKSERAAEKGRNYNAAGPTTGTGVGL